MAALVAIGQRERTGFATTGAFFHFVFGLLLKLFQCSGGQSSGVGLDVLVNTATEGRRCLCTCLVDVGKFGGLCEGQVRRRRRRRRGRHDLSVGGCSSDYLFFARR